MAKNPRRILKTDLIFVSKEIINLLFYDIKEFYDII